MLRLFSRLNIGGPSLHVVLLTERLRPLGYDTRLVVGQESKTEGDLRAYAAEHGVEPLTLPHFGRAIRPMADLRTLGAVIRLIRAFRPQIVHTHTAKAGFIGRVASRLTRTPVVVHTYHGHVLTGYFGRFETLFYRSVERLLSRWSDRLIAVSDAVKHDLLGQGIGDDHKIVVVPLGLELERLADALPQGRLRDAAGVGPDAPLVGIVGRLVAIKDLPTFLEAARIVVQSVPDARFAVVGDGEERPLLEDRTRHMGLEGRVHFHGWQRDTREVFGDLDLTVNCSRNEGTPVALIESLAAGRPVVATSVGGTPDLLAGGEYGQLVPAGDAPGLAAAIVHALRHRDEARRQALAGQRRVLTRYSIGRLVADMDGLYRGLLLQKGEEVTADARA